MSIIVPSSHTRIGAWVNIKMYGGGGGNPFLAPFVDFLPCVNTTTGVGDISIIFPCSFAVGITQQYGIYVLLG